MAITDKIVTKERLAYFKSKIDAAFKVKQIKVNGTLVNSYDSGQIALVKAAEITSMSHPNTDPEVMDKVLDEISISGGSMRYNSKGGSVAFYFENPGENLFRIHAEGEAVNDGVYDKAVPTKEYVDSNAGDKNVIEIIRLNGTQQSVAPDKSVNLFLPTWDFEQGATGYAKSVKLALRTEDGQGTRRAMSVSIDNATDPEKVMLGVWANLDTQMTLAEVPTISAMGTAITDALAGISGVDFQIVPTVQDLPATGEKGVFYLIPNSGAGQNVYDEYVWVNSGTHEAPNYHYEKIGTTAVDMSGYVREEDLVEITEAEIDAMFT